jgi:hypothetical protein
MCFSSKTICSFENRTIGCVCKTGSNYALKDEIGLAVFETFRKLLLAVQLFGLWLAVLLRVLRLTVHLGKLLVGFSLVHTVFYSAHNKEKEIKVLPLSSNTIKKRK